MKITELRAQTKKLDNLKDHKSLNTGSFKVVWGDKELDIREVSIDYDRPLFNDYDHRTQSILMNYEFQMRALSTNPSIDFFTRGTIE